MTAVYAELEDQLGPEIWERYPGEPANAYGYFVEFCALGKGRKIKDLAEKVRKTTQYLYRLSSKWNWSVRAGAKDLDDARQRDYRLMDEFVRLEAQKVLVARGMLHWAAQFLNTMTLEKLADMTAGEVAKWAATANQLGRSPFGEPDHRVTITRAEAAAPAFKPISGMTPAERQAELGALLRGVGERMAAGEIITADEDDLAALLAIPAQREL